jgi:prophage antirepressor-like protein
MDIFNNIIKYNDNDILITFDKDGNIWFGLRTILQLLNYTSIDKTIYNIIIDKSNMKKYKDIETFLERKVLKFQKTTYFINEIGLYELLTKSNKPIAKVFMNKYLTDIMPTIRKTGKYILADKDKEKMDKINEKLNNYKKELEYYSNKYNFEPSENGYFYIKKKLMIINSKKVLCYKIGFAKDFPARVANYKVGEFEQKFISIIPVNLMLIDEIYNFTIFLLVRVFVIYILYRSHVVAIRYSNINQLIKEKSCAMKEDDMCFKE